MTARRIGLLATAVSLGLMAPLAHAEFVPVTPKTEAFLTCTGPSKEYVVGGFVNPDAGVPSWGPAKPVSVTTGAGCGKVDDGVFSGATYQSPYHFGFGGSYTGNVDAITVDLYSAHAAGGRQSLAPVDLKVSMRIDGISMFGTTSATNAAGVVTQVPAPQTVTVTPVATGATGGVTRYSFIVVALELLLEGDNVEHSIDFDVALPSTGAEGWLWGAAEAPSGVVVNPTAGPAAALAADPREVREAELSGE